MRKSVPSRCSSLVFGGWWVVVFLQATQSAPPNPLLILKQPKVGRDRESVVRPKEKPNPGRELEAAGRVALGSSCWGKTCVSTTVSAPCRLGSWLLSF